MNYEHEKKNKQLASLLFCYDTDLSIQANGDVFDLFPTLLPCLSNVYVLTIISEYC